MTLRKHEKEQEHWVDIGDLRIWNQCSVFGCSTLSGFPVEDRRTLQTHSPLMFLLYKKVQKEVSLCGDPQALFSSNNASTCTGLKYPGRRAKLPSQRALWETLNLHIKGFFANKMDQAKPNQKYKLLACNLCPRDIPGARHIRPLPSRLSFPLVPLLAGRTLSSLLAPFSVLLCPLFFLPIPLFQIPYPSSNKLPFIISWLLGGGGAHHGPAEVLSPATSLPRVYETA